MKEDYKKNGSSRLAARCLPALAMAASHDITEDLLILAVPEFYFEHTHVRDRGRPGRSERYGSAIFPVERWNHFENASDRIARTTNSIEGWHYGTQAPFQCRDPILWTFMKGHEKDMQTQLTPFLQTIMSVINGHVIK